MLDTFFGALERVSVGLFYADAPAVPPRTTHGVIIEVRRVKGAGHPTEYHYDAPGHLEGTLWERCVRHSLRQNGGSDGFLMPYHRLLKAAGDHPVTESGVVTTCVASRHNQFDPHPYASEHR